MITLHCHRIVRIMVICMETGPWLQDLVLYGNLRRHLQENVGTPQYCVEYQLVWLICYSLPPVSWLLYGEVVGLCWYSFYLKEFLSCCVRLCIYWRCSPRHFDFDRHQISYAILFILQFTTQLKHNMRCLMMLINIACWRILTVLFIFSNIWLFCAWI
jgi:hypothetical protein